MIPVLMMLRTYDAPARCAGCGCDQPAPCGLTLADVETLQPICSKCAERTAPTLVQVRALVTAARDLTGGLTLAYLD